MMVFQQRGGTIAGRNCFVDEGGEKDDGKGMRNTEQWCFSTKRGETIAGRNCSGSENDGGMGFFCDWEKNESADQRCLSIGEMFTSVFQRCFGIRENK